MTGPATDPLAGPATDPLAGPATSPRRTASAHVLRGALAMLSTQPFTWSATLLLTIFLPRFLSDAEYGELALAQSIALLAGTTVALGVPTALIRRVASDPERMALHTTTALVLLVGLAMPAALGLTLLWPLFATDLVSTGALAVVLAGMVVGQANLVVMSLLVGRQRHLQFAWLNATSSVCFSVVGLLAIVAGGGVLGFLIVTLLSSAVVTVVAWRLARVHLEPAGLAPRELVGLARAGLPFLGLDVMNRIRIDLDVLYLGTLVGQGAVGLWAAAGRIAAIPVFIPTMIVTPLLPALTQVTDDRPALERALRRSLDAAIVLTVGPCAGIVAVAPAIPDVLGWGRSFEASAPIMGMLTASLPLISVGMIVGASLTALGKERLWLAVGVGATVVHGLLGVGLILLFERRGIDGALGLALGRLLTEVLIVGVGIALLPRGILGWSFALFVARVLLAGGALVVVASRLVAIWLPLAVVGGALIYGLALIGLRAVRVDDLTHAGGMARAVVLRRLGRAS